MGTREPVQASSQRQLPSTEVRQGRRARKIRRRTAPDRSLERAGSSGCVRACALICCTRATANCCHSRLVDGGSEEHRMGRYPPPELAHADARSRFYSPMRPSARPARSRACTHWSEWVNDDVDANKALSVPDARSQPARPPQRLLSIRLRMYAPAGVAEENLTHVGVTARGTHNTLALRRRSQNGCFFGDSVSALRAPIVMATLRIMCTPRGGSGLSDEHAGAASESV